MLSATLIGDLSQSNGYRRNAQPHSKCGKSLFFNTESPDFERPASAREVY